MSDGSNIGWTDATWNPVRGCTRVSSGCDSCYAIDTAARFDRPGMWGEGLTKLRNGERDWSGKVSLLPEKLAAPLHWRKPRLVFPCSGADLFHHKVPFEYIAAVFGIMLATPQHTYQTLTKRPERELAFHERLDEQAPQSFPHLPLDLAKARYVLDAATSRIGKSVAPWWSAPQRPWPPPNYLAGTSAETQKDLDDRMASLRQIGAVRRFLSLEPLLGELDLTEYIHPVPFVRALAHHERTNHLCGGAGHLADCTECGAQWEPDTPDVHWIVVGGESGRKHRPCEIEWIDKIVQQCRKAGVPVFVKQDSGLRPGKQGRLSADLWACKDVPTGIVPASALVKSRRSSAPSDRAAASAPTRPG